MEEFIDLYRYLAGCYAELHKLEREKIEGFLHRISGLVASEKTGPVLIKLLLDLIKRSDEVSKLDDSLNTILPAIIEIEAKFAHSDISVNSGKSDVSDNLNRQLNTPVFDKKTILRSFGACKVYPNIFEYVFANMETKICNNDVAVLIKKYYDDVLKRHLASSSSVTYANCYIRYMVGEGLIIDNGSGIYSKKTNNSNKDNKETKELKEFGESINGNGKNQPSESEDEPKSATEPTLTDEPKDKNEFEQFQDRILETARTKHWNQVKIETIEEAFKGTKSPGQVEKALVRLVVDEKVTQFPPEPKDLIYAEEHEESKPKGYIIFKAP